MATCDFETLRAEACSNGFFALSEKQSWAAILQSFSNLGGNTLNAEQLLAQAKAGGLCGLSEKQAKAAILQRLCNLSEGLLRECINLIPAGTMYDGDGNYIVPVIGGHLYMITWGANEVGFTNTGGNPETNPGATVPGVSVLFTASMTTQFFLFGLEGGSLVTASICEV